MSAEWSGAPGPRLAEDRNWPAWILSVAVHALLLIVIGLAVRSPTRRGSADPERRVGIALAFRTRPSVEYFEDDQLAAEAASAADGNPNEFAPAAAELAGPSDAEPLPSSVPRSAVSPELALPLPGDIPSAAMGQLAAPETSGRATRRPARQVDYSQWVQQEAARLRSLQPAGPTATVQLFGGSPAEGRSFVFLLDRSKSMGSGGLNALSAAERELGTALEALEPTHRFAVLAYHHEVVYMHEPRLLQATEQHKRRLSGFLNGLAAYGQTEHEYGLQAALALAPDVVYLFSDAGEPPPNEIAVRRLVRSAQSQRTTLHMIRFGFGPMRDDGGFMRRLADETGGGYTYVNMSGSK